MNFGSRLTALIIIGVALASAPSVPAARSTGRDRGLRTNPRSGSVRQEGHDTRPLLPEEAAVGDRVAGARGKTLANTSTVSSAHASAHFPGLALVTLAAPLLTLEERVPGIGPTNVTAGHGLPASGRAPPRA